MTEEEFLAWWEPLVRHLGFYCRDPEDIAGLAVLQFLQAERRSSIKNPRAYLYQIAHHRLIERWRRKHSDEVVPLNPHHVALWARPIDPGQIAEVNDLIERAFERMTPLQREAIVLQDRGYRNDEVAETLGCSEAAVRHLRKKVYRKSRKMDDPQERP